MKAVAGLARVAAVLVLTLAVGVSVSEGVSVKTWSPSSPEELADGTLDGTAVDHHGYVRLAPAFRALWGPDSGIVWAIAPAGRAGAFVALSGPARLLRVEPGSEPEAWYEGAADLLVTAVSRDGRKGVVFGISPSGNVMHATTPEDGRVLFETNARFVWSLLGGKNGTVWAGTGSPGRLIRYTPKSGEATLFESEDDPIRCLAGLTGGGVVAGTGAKGRVIRFDAEGRPFVLLDAEEDEIVSLAVAADGTIYALAAGAPKPETPPSRARARAPVGDSVKVTAKPPEEGEKAGAGTEVRAERATAKKLASKGGGALYRLDPDGGVLQIWRSDTDTPFALLATESGTVLVATGNAGKIFELDRRGEGTQLLRFPSDQATALATAPDRAILVAGATDARVAVLGPGLPETGRYLTAPIDANGVADWGRIRWDSDLPGGAAISMEVRSGNTAEPDETWSEWVAVDDRGRSEGATDAPPSRWLQARASLRPSRDGASPVLRRVELSYRPRNHPPRIGSLTVEPVGIAWTRAVQPNQSGRRPVVADDPVVRRTVVEMGPARARSAPVRKYYEAGARTFSWEAEDADGDNLDFSIEIRREHESGWFPLADGIRNDFFSWDSRAMPDGMYRVRLSADDGPDNPPSKSFETDRVSGPFRVDNTPPVLTGFAVRSRGDVYEITFTARDPNGRVEAVEYALDGKTWHPVDPEDGVADSEEEGYRIEIDAGSLPGNAGHLVLRVLDSSGNLGGDMRMLDRE